MNSVFRQIELAAGKDEMLESLAKDIADDRAYSASGFLCHRLANEFLALDQEDRMLVHGRVERLLGKVAS